MFNDNMSFADMASLPYQSHCFDIKDGHIQCCKVIWGRDDVIATAKNAGYELTDDEIDEVLYCLIDRHDADVGVSWETIDFWIEEVVKERKDK